MFEPAIASHEILDPVTVQISHDATGLLFALVGYRDLAADAALEHPRRVETLRLCGTVYLLTVLFAAPAITANK